MFVFKRLFSYKNSNYLFIIKQYNSFVKILCYDAFKTFYPTKRNYHFNQPFG